MYCCVSERKSTSFDEASIMLLLGLLLLGFVVLLRSKPAASSVAVESVAVSIRDSVDLSSGLILELDHASNIHLGNFAVNPIFVSVHVDNFQGTGADLIQHPVAESRSPIGKCTFKTREHRHVMEQPAVDGVPLNAVHDLGLVHCS